MSRLPNPSPIPLHNRIDPSLPPSSTSHSDDNDTTSRPPHYPPTSPRIFPLIKHRLKALDLNDAGSSIFFTHCNPSTILADAVETVLVTLYQNPTKGKHHIPPTRSVTLFLRSMDGVAYTAGSDLDDDHKEIHFSLDYIRNIAPRERQRDEIKGVLVHEMVHCWQGNGGGKAPSGLIEGIADFVRLKAGLSPPHWKKESGGDWDAGYQHTGYFLDWLEGKFGEGSVRRINGSLCEGEYVEKEFWGGLFGQEVEELWTEYGKSFEEEEGDCGGAKIVEKDGKEIEVFDNS